MLPSAMIFPTYPWPRTVVAAKRAIIGSKAEKEKVVAGISTKSERCGAANQDAPGDYGGRRRMQIG